MRTALITGTSSGIGLHLAHQLCEEGWTVFGILRDEARLAASLQQAGIEESPRFHRVIADINAPEVMQSVLRDVPVPDLLVNNAGYGLYGPFEELPEGELRSQFETNFFAALRLIRHCLPGMRERGSGRILNITSILGTMVLPSGLAYCSSKWALEAASEAIRYEVAPFGIQVCAVEPGLVRTSFKSSLHVPGPIMDPSSPYAFLNRRIREDVKGYGTHGAMPEDAARSIIRLLRHRNLPARYRVGVDAELYHFLKSFLPAAALDALVRIYVERLHGT